MRLRGLKNSHHLSLEKKIMSVKPVEEKKIFKKIWFVAAAHNSCNPRAGWCWEIASSCLLAAVLLPLHPCALTRVTQPPGKSQQRAHAIVAHFSCYFLLLLLGQCSASLFPLFACSHMASDGTRKEVAYLTLVLVYSLCLPLYTPKHKAKPRKI